MKQYASQILMVFLITIFLSVMPASVGAQGLFPYEKWKLALTILSPETGNEETRLAFFERQVLPIMEAFNLTDYTLNSYSELYKRPFTLDDLRDDVVKDRRNKKGVWTIFTMNMPGHMSGHYYISKIEGGSPFPLGESTIYADDVLLLETPKEDISLDDFFIAGGNVDTPPTQIVDVDDVLPLTQRFFEKYRHGALICVGSDTRKEVEKYRPPQLPMNATPDYIANFSTESYNVDEIPEIYKSDNTIGNDVYVIPLALWGEDAAYAAVQTFYVKEKPSCTVSSYIEGLHKHVKREVPLETAGPTSPSMIEAYKVYANDAVQACEEIRTEYGVPREEFKCELCCNGRWISGVYVDKLFFREPESIKAVEADWIMFSDTSSRSHECFDVSYNEAIDPAINVDFDYEILERTEAQVRVRLKAESSGNIVNYYWDLGDGSDAEGNPVEHSYEPGQYSVVLKVVDDEGREGRIMKTINLGERIEFKIWADNAGLGDETIVHVRCPSKEPINVRIDKVNENLEKEFAVIESQPVYCNSDLPIGPFSLAGRYLIEGSLNGVEKEAGFSVS